MHKALGGLTENEVSGTICVLSFGFDGVQGAISDEESSKPRFRGRGNGTIVAVVLEYVLVVEVTCERLVMVLEPDEIETEEPEELTVVEAIDESLVVVVKLDVVDAAEPAAPVLEDIESLALNVVEPLVLDVVEPLLLIAVESIVLRLDESAEDVETVCVFKAVEPVAMLLVVVGFCNDKP